MTKKVTTEADDVRRLLATCQRCGWDMGRVAAELGLTRRELRTKLDRFKRLGSVERLGPGWRRC